MDAFSDMQDGTGASYLYALIASTPDEVRALVLEVGRERKQEKETSE